MGLHYQGYLLNCDPMPLMDGRFGAQIVITSKRGEIVIEKLFPSLEAFSNRYDAIEYARRWGKAWVDDNE